MTSEKAKPTLEATSVYIPTTSEDVYAALFRKINGPSSEFEKVFREEFAKEHPTLQQAFVRHMLIPALEILRDLRPDLRNQASHDFARDALANAINLYFPTI